MDGKIELFTPLFNLKNMKIGILLSGCGVYDGAEIHETVLMLQKPDPPKTKEFHG